MITLNQILVALLVASSASSGLLAANGKVVSPSAAVVLGRATVLERPAAAAQLVARANRANKEAVALEVVASIAKTDPDLLAAVVGAVVSEVPNAAAKVASTAARLAPDRLFDIAKAAVSTAPRKSEDVALALAALQPKELLKICLAIGEGAPSEAARVIIPLARAFPLQSGVIYSGLVYGATGQEGAISESLLKALPGLENTTFGKEVRKTRAGLAGTGTTVKRKVTILAKSLEVIKALAESLQKQLSTTSGTGTGTVSVSGFASDILDGAIIVDTKTGAVTINTAKIDANSDLGKALAKDSTLATQFASDASKDLGAQITNTNSALNKVITNDAKTDDPIDDSEIVRVILSKDTVRAYSN